MEAARAVAKLGFVPLENMDRFPTDHLPAMIRKTGWEWGGDYYDPAMPLAVEIHFRFWNESLERLAVPTWPNSGAAAVFEPWLGSPWPP